MIVMKSRVFYLSLFIVIVIVMNAVSFKVFYKKEDVEYANLCYYEEDNNYILVEKNEIADNFISYLYKDSSDNYIGKIYDYDSNKELLITDLIKEDKLEEYNNKIKELIYLKYPKFISDVLVLDETDKSYLFRDNELIIYFNNYVIEPEVLETLYLKVNYNEIKDYLNFLVIYDSDYENESAKKSIAFTFDDSPNKNKTNVILEELKNNYAHATFFVVGSKAIYNKDLLISIKNMGNEIGSHTYNHANMGKMTDEEILNDYETMNNLYKNLFKTDLKYIRPPYGVIKKNQLDLIPTSYILWSLDTNDWRYRNSDYLVNYVLENVQDGDIILFHDSYDSTVDAIKKLLPLLYSKGYQVMSVSELFDLKKISIQNNQIYHNAY